MPKIVLEGRRTINNIQRSASLFLVKTIYASILAIVFLIANMPYPFMPIHLTLISMVTIGIPSFVLALEPNKERIKGQFLKNVISKAIPTALTVVSNIIITAIVSYKLELKTEVYSSICVILTGLTGLMLLSNLCKPLDIFKIKNNKIEKTYASQGIRTTLFILMIIMFTIGITVFRNWFSITITNEVIPLIIGLSIISFFIFFGLNWLINMKKDKLK
ncbi:MAG: hypothetical protein HFJ20_01665 [Clostridia bacterium]|nr:hypothetical protein [Clostridia bacterium]